MGGVTVVRFIVLFLFTMAIAFGCAFQGQSQPSLSLGLPIDCQLGNTCFILQYPDRDPSPKAIDYGCGRMTSDQHKGTDFAISDEHTMKAGVPVLAVAAGTVLRTRDGILDRRIVNNADLEAVQGSECGNGVVIDHGEGWETQYCHLRKDSVSVKQGDRVTAATPIGLVGESGAASFPHIHLSVRYQGEVIDPSVGVTTETGCDVKPNPLWAEELPYKPTGLIRSGIATQAPALDDLWEGNYRDEAIAANSDAMIFWVHVYGVLQGDQENLEIRDPQGNVWVENTRTINDSNRVWMTFVGKKTRQIPLKPGTWTGRYELSRDGQSIIQEQKKFQVVVAS